MAPENEIPKVQLIRLAHAATATGISTPAFRVGIQRGDIPLVPVRLGGVTYVNARALANWLNASHNPNGDLFQ